MNFRHKWSRPKRITNDQSESEKVPTRLELLTLGDRNLSEALSYYLLLDPKTQIPVLGTPEFHCANGLIYKEKGDRNAARWEFELAARIEISSLNVEKAEEYLELADSVSNSPEQTLHHRAILAHLDWANEIAAQYYGETLSSDRRKEIPNIAYAR